MAQRRLPIFANAARAISRGVELDLRAQPVEGLTTFASFTYDDTYFASYANAACPYELSYITTSCNLTGQTLSITPKFAMALGGEYSRHLDIFDGLSPKPVVGYAGADYTYQTGFFSNYDNSIYSYIPAYGLLNLHAGVEFDDRSWDLSAWVHNALDTHYFINLSAVNLRRWCDQRQCRRSAHGRRHPQGQTLTATSNPWRNCHV